MTNGIVLAVVGTRVLACDGDPERVAARIHRAITRLRPDRVVSGGADGVDSIAEQVATAMGYSEAAGTLVVLRPTVKRFHGTGGYGERDERIARECTHLLRLACRHATTYGSGWTADHAERLNRTVVRELICPGVS